MDALALNMLTAPLLPESALSDTINKFRETERSLEPASLLRFYNAKTGSYAVVTLVSQLSKAVEFLRGNEEAQAEGLFLSHWLVQAIEVLVSNNH